MTAIIALILLFLPVDVNSYVIQNDIDFEIDNEWLEQSMRLNELKRMRRTNEVSKLSQEMQKVVKRFLNQLQKEGIQIHILETYRHPKVQEALYIQGRQRLSLVNQVRKEAGLLPIGIKENKIITFAQGEKSAHVRGLAIDIIPIVDGRRCYGNAILWEKIGKIGEQCGLTWGGRWRQKDLPHFELSRR